MTMDAEDASWFEAMKAKGHMPILEENGNLDVFVLEYDHHNGPGCSACGWSCCHHCDSIESIPECTSIEGTFTVIPTSPLMIEGKS